MAGDISKLMSILEYILENILKITLCKDTLNSSVKALRVLRKVIVQRSAPESAEEGAFLLSAAN